MNRTALLSAGFLSGRFSYARLFSVLTIPPQTESISQETMVVVGSRAPTQISQIPGAVLCGRRCRASTADQLRSRSENVARPTGTGA